MESAICIVVILILLYLVLRKEPFLGVNPSDVARVLEAAPKATVLNYNNFNQSIYPTAIHEWTYQEIRNLAINKAVSPGAIQFLLGLDKKHAVHPSFLKPLMTYPNETAPPKVSNFVLQAGTPSKPVWIV
jgi:hypothetical protein